MSTTLRVTGVLVGLFAAALCAAQSPGCPDVAFSPEVLARFPRAKDACLDVIEKGGKQYAVFKADLASVQGNTVRVRMKMPDGSYSDVKSIRTRPDLRVLIDGKPYAVHELAPNQELTTYVRVDQPMIALAPANQDEPVDAVPLAAAGPEHLAAAGTPSMPHTASPAAGLALMGIFCMALAIALRISRRRG